jgi:hypothetical protein
MGNDGGVWSTTDVTNPSLNWTNLNASLGTIQFYPALSINPSNIAIGYGGAQDNGTHKYTGVPTWSEVAGGDGGWTAIDPVNPNNVYGEYVYLNPYKSTDGGNTFSGYLRSGITECDTSGGAQCPFIAPLVIDPSQPQNLYLGSYRVYQTNNGMISWTAISGDLTQDLGRSASTLSTLAVAPSDSNTVFAGTNNGLVWVSTNVLGATPTWTDITGNLPVRVVTNFAVSPTSASTVYVSLSGFKYGTNNGGHVYKCTFNPAIPAYTWTDVSGDLPNVPVNDIVIDPDIPNTMYIGTDTGVFRTSNGGVNWVPLMNGLPNAAIVTGLKLHRASRTLRAGTLGRGMWDLSVPLPLATSSVTNQLRPGTPTRKPGSPSSTTATPTVDSRPLGGRIRRP